MEAMNLREKLTSLINYRYMTGFRANNKQRVIGAFCNFHVNSKQRETNEIRAEAAISGENRCVTTLITATKETRECSDRQANERSELNRWKGWQ